MSWSIESLKKYANENKIPMILKDPEETTLDNDGNLCPYIEITILKKDYSMIKNWLAENKPVCIGEKINVIRDCHLKKINFGS